MSSNQVSTPVTPITGDMAEVVPGQAVIFKDMAEIMRGAELMSSAKGVVPSHLLGNPGGCMAIIMQAQRWGFDAFIVAQKTHVINGNLGYEAQLVNAVVQASGMCGRFYYEYKGEGASLACRAGAVLQGEQDITWSEWLRVSDVKVQNSHLWKTNPRQQIGYLQVKNFARAYCPGAILGVYSADELRDSPNSTQSVEKNMGPADVIPQEDGFCTDEKFKECFPGWQEQVLEKSKEPEKLIKFLNGKGLKFTDEQIDRIMNIGAA